MDVPKLRTIKISGEISVEPFNETDVFGHTTLFLIVGPTGSGKSSFIEAFAGKSQELTISKDQLDGYTQKVTAYRIVNTYKRGDPVLLVDTPGFSDSKISEMEVMDMIRSWLESIGRLSVDTVLFLIPINAPRLAGSKRRTIDMFKAFLKGGLHSIIFVTTMWDALTNQQAQKRAESNFLQLRGKILKEFIRGGATITRFTNTKESTLKILDGRISGTHEFGFRPSPIAPHLRLLYQDLHSRIENGLLTKNMIESDIARPDAKFSIELYSILERQRNDNQRTLWKFIRQYMSSAEPSTGFEGVSQDLRKAMTVVAHTTQPDSAYEDMLYVWAQLGSISPACCPDEFGAFNDAARAELKRQRAYVCFHTRVDAALREKNTIELELAQCDTTNLELQSTLQQKRLESQDALWKAVVQWIRYRNYPKGMDDAVQKLRAAVIAQSRIIQLDSAYKDMFYLWEHQPDRFVYRDEIPEESGFFSSRARSQLKKWRKYFESRRSSKSMFRSQE